MRAFPLLLCFCCAPAFAVLLLSVALLLLLAFTVLLLCSKSRKRRFQRFETTFDCKSMISVTIGKNTASPPRTNAHRHPGFVEIINFVRFYNFF